MKDMGEVCTECKAIKARLCYLEKTTKEIEDCKQEDHRDMWEKISTKISMRVFTLILSGLGVVLLFITGLIFSELRDVSAEVKGLSHAIQYNKGMQDAAPQKTK